MTDEPVAPDARAALDDAACGLLRTAADGRILFANRTFLGWVGYAEDELVGRRRLQDLLGMGGKIFHQTHWAPLLQMQGSISEVKLDVVHASGTAIPMVLNAVRRVVGDVVRHDVAMFVARDRDTYERELVQSRQRLEELVAEAKDRALFSEQMVGIVSHDLRNPLSSIHLGAELLASHELTAPQHKIIERIGRATARANRLILDLLDFTQARLGRGLSVSRVPIDLHSVVAALVEELSPVYPGRGLRHVRQGHGTCTADPDRLAQVIGNLVSNAMVYGQPDQLVTVMSAIRQQDVSVAVHNHGEPIPAALQPQLFQPMTRGSSVGKASRSVGLGLFIVREIAKAHRGVAMVESTREQGTTFTIRVPRD
jgi:phosphoserine phosphatase RsbU/P